jgi:hypothetical protein
MGLFLAALTDPAAIDKINDALTRVDGAAGLILVADGVRPTTNLFPGMYLLEKTSKKKYYLDDTGVMVAGVYTGGTWIQDIGGDVFYGANDLSEQQFTLSNTGVVGNLGTANYPSDKYETPTVNFTTDGVKTVCIESEWNNTVIGVAPTPGDNLIRAYFVVDGVAYQVRDNSAGYIIATQDVGVAGPNTHGSGRADRWNKAKLYLTPAAGAHTAFMRFTGGRHNTGGSYGYSAIATTILGVNISG